MSNLLEFHIPLPRKISSNSIYGGMHWSKRKKIADEFHNVVFYTVKNERVEKIKEYPVHVYYLFTLKGRRMDVLNTSFLAKLLEDGLVRSGILKDDSQEYVKMVTLRCEKGNENCVDVMICSIDDIMV